MAFLDVRRNSWAEPGRNDRPPGSVVRVLEPSEGNGWSETDDLGREVECYLEAVGREPSGPTAEAPLVEWPMWRRAEGDRSAN
jgi:hypothetical protein